MARLRTAGVVSGVPNAGTGDVPTLDAFISEAPVSATFTATAESFTAGWCVGAAATFTGVGISGTEVMINATTFAILSTTPVASNFRLHLLTSNMATPLASKTAFAVVEADIAKYLGFIDLGTPIDLTSTVQWVEQNGLAKPVKLTTANLIGYLEIRTTATLAAVSHIPTLHTYPLS